jgi:O-antigen/teichoic acid export membrane protein
MSVGFARNTFFGVVASLAGSLGSFATTIAIGRTLGLVESGGVYFALWLVSLAGAVTDLGVYGSLTRYLPETTRTHGLTVAKGLAGFLLKPFAAVTALGFAAFTTLAGLVLLTPSRAEWLGLGDDAAKWFLVGALFAGQNLSNFVVGYFQGMQRFGTVAALITLSSTVRLAATIVGAVYAGSTGALMGYAAGAALLVPVPFLAVLWRVQIEATLTRRAKRFARFSWASTLALAMVVARPEVAFLHYLGGNEAVALYAAAFTLANLAMQGPYMLTSGLIPFFSENSGPDGTDALRRMMASGTRILAFLILPMCFGTAAVANELLQLLFGRAFGDAAGAAVLLLLAACLGGNTALLTGLINGKERNDFLFCLNLASAVLTIALGFVLVPALGLEGAATGRAIVQLCFLVASAWFVVHRLGFGLPFLHVGRLCIAAVTCGCAAKGVLLAMPTASGLPAAFLVGTASYLVLVRALGGLDQSDVQRLASLFAGLPSALSLPANAVFKRLIPSPSTKGPPLKGR